jgi:hypothetical protein
MTTGIPRSHHDVVRAAKDLGYRHDHTNGGHVFYTKDSPDKKLGQEKRLIIPYPEIQAEKTLRNILNGMGYFKAHGLNKDGQPKLREKADPAAEEEKKMYKLETRFIQDTRIWKQQMKQHLRHSDLVAHPGPQPEAQGFEPSPFGPKGLKR